MAAVLREGLTRLRQLGARRALVLSSADDSASLGLYESVAVSLAELTASPRHDER